MPSAPLWRADGVEALLDDLVVHCRRPYLSFAARDACLARLQQGRFEMLSAAWEHILGYAARELQGRPLGALLTEHSRGDRSALSRLFDRRVHEPYALDLLRKDRSAQHLHCYRRFESADQTLLLACVPLAVTCLRCRAR